MYFRQDSSLFLFCLLFCFLCSCIACTRTVKVSTANVSEELSTNYLSDEDEEDEELDGRMILLLTVIGAIWLALTGFAVTCIVAGIVVSTQWPDPSFCCWTQSMSDKSHGCGGFSLFRMNLRLAMKNMLLVLLLCLTDLTIFLPIPAALFIWHCVAICLLRRSFNRFGWPLLRENVIEAPLVYAPSIAGRRGDEDIVVVRSGRAGYR